VVDFAVKYANFSGGDWGITADDKAWNYRRGHVLYNEFSATNMAVYPSGLLGVRAGWKRLDTTGMATGLPATYTGSIRGFDVMGNKLMLATVDKTYDIYWDLNLAPGGSLPANNPIPLPSGLGALDYAQFLRGADTAMKEFLVTGGKLYYRTGDPAGSWTLTGPSGKNISIVTRWNLYLVAVDRDQPWIIWFSNVDSNGPNFLNWPAANYLFVGTTEPITTLLSIFNQLYAGRASGWWGISGVLGVLASVRELALGNGPLDQRMASVTTDNRIAYWPMEKVPAFWSGGRVQLVETQRMDPRKQWVSATPDMSRTRLWRTGSVPGGDGWSQALHRIGMQNYRDILNFSDSLHEVGTPVWTQSPARSADTGTGSFSALNNLATGTSLPMAPGWTTLALGTSGSAAPQAWVATDGTNTAWRSTTATGPTTVHALVDVGNGTPVPAGCALAIFVNDVELCRTEVTKPTTYLGVWMETSFAVNDVVSLRFFNHHPVNPVILSATHRTSGPFLDRPFLKVEPRYPEDAGDYWVCPTTSRYDIHFESCGGSQITAFQLLVNRRVVASCTPGWYGGGDDFTTNVLDVRDVALTAGDLVGVSVVAHDYTTPSSLYVNRIDGPEGTVMPYLRITDRNVKEINGTLAIPGDQVVVTPTNRRLMFLGDDGATSKVYSYGSTGIWTHDTVPVLLGGMAPSDVRGAYQLPEHVVFATQRTYNAESFPKIWSVVHDLDRPARMSDRWSSPYDQSMPAGDVLVRGQVNLAAWYDSQGRQVRVRSVEVHFRKWDQGIVGGTNMITARVDARSAYDYGTTPGIEATWQEPMTSSSPDGTEDSWRFNVGEQGFGNGFQVVFTGIYGVALREVVVTVDVRTDRA
jgi:hypothetical protein